MGLTDNLLAPSTSEDFDPEWARKVLVAFKSRQDPDWLLARVLRVLEVKGEENKTPGQGGQNFYGIYYRPHNGWANGLA